jgi:uncharacterized protein (TIGR03083 family)
VSEADLGELYRQRRLAITALLAGLSDDDAKRPVPTCPEWLVRDLVAHVTGVVADALAGNMAGAPGYAWTAAQVAARRGRAVDDMLAEWSETGPRFEAALAGTGVRPAVIDIASHEQDVRTALGRPGERANEAILIGSGWLLSGLDRRVSAAGLPALRVVTEDGEQAVGAGEPVGRVDTSRFEVFRATMGRRSRRQIEAMIAVDDPASYVEAFVVFGPAERDIDE